jgi:hypothetical protein
MGKFFTALSVFCLASRVLHGALPQSWYSSTPTNKNLTAAMYGQGQLVVVGLGSLIMKSSDGFTWTQALQLNGPPGTGSSDHLHSAAYGNGMFVAGGYLNMHRVISPDGINWTNTTSLGPEIVYGLTFANGRFVGVGRGIHGNDSYIITSVNGINWSSPAVYPTTNILRSVAFGNGLYVAVGDLGTIVTSSDAFNWTVRQSGTANSLRAVTFTGSQFIAGGDVSTIVISTDGISWSPGAPPAFDVKGLAWGGGAIVAVGSYNGDGRLHASTDGFGWPGNFTLVSQPLNGISYVNGRFVAVGNNGLILQSELTTQNGTNDWTKPTSGYWQEPYWSRGELPSTNDAVIRFANAGYKALAIDYNTTINYPNSLTMRRLEVDAPEDSSNLLLLNYAGFETPLHVLDNLVIGSRGALLDQASALKAWALFLDGTATFAEGAQGEFQYLRIGDVTGRGELNISNAVLSTAYMGVADKLNQYGGSNLIGNLNVWLKGVYNLNNGTVLVSNGASVGGDYTEAQFTGQNGFARMLGGLGIGSAFASSGSGTLHLSGTTFESDRIDVRRGSILQTAGAASVGGFSVGDGYLILYGQRQFGTNVELGVYSLFGGQLDTVTTYAAGGRFEQYGGFAKTHQLSVGESGRAIINSGQMEMSQLVIGGEGSQFIQNGGVTIITNGITLGAVANGEIVLNVGSFKADGLYGFTGRFNQWGGSHWIRRMWLPFGQGDMTAYLRGGTLTSGEVRLGAGPNNRGVFFHVAGLHVNTNAIIMVGQFPDGPAQPLGDYVQEGGRLESPLLYGNGGQFNMRGGTASVGEMLLDRGGLAALSDGDFRARDVTIGTINDAPAYSFINQWTGTFIVTNTLTVVGIFDLYGGYVSASNIVVSTSRAQFRRREVSFVNAGSFSLLGGIFYAGVGTNDLGILIIGGFTPSRIDLQTNGSTVIRFRDSHTVSWSQGAQLVITNWDGSLNGGGPDRIYIGNSVSGLTPSQLAQIVFARPAGLPADNYGAKLLATGEIVPLTIGPVLAYSRTGNSLTFSWDYAAYQLLSSTNVAGPYQPLNPQPGSPYTILFTEAQRFFELRGIP